MLLRPASASGGELPVEVIPPRDAPEERDQPGKGHRPKQHNEAYVDNPEDAAPSGALFPLFLHLLRPDHIRPTYKRIFLPPIPTICICTISATLPVIIILVVTASDFHVLHVEVQGEPAAEDPDDGEAEANEVEVVDGGEDQLPEGEREPDNRNRDMLVAFAATAFVTSGHLILIFAIIQSLIDHLL